MKKGKLVGKGCFSKVYENPEDPSSVLIVSCCPTKECMSFGWGNSGDLFPKLERLDDCGDFQCFKMKRYSKTRKIKPFISDHQWQLYRALGGLMCKFKPPSKISYCHWQEQFESLPDEFEDEKSQLLEMLDALANYGDDMCFEISPRNIAIDNGKLILLDCFFMISKLKEVRK